MASQTLSQPTSRYSLPILIDKLTQLSLHFPRALDSSRAQLKRVSVIRDQAYLKMAFFIGDMAVLEVLERLKVRHERPHGSRMIIACSSIIFRLRRLQLEIRYRIWYPKKPMHATCYHLSYSSYYILFSSG